MVELLIQDRMKEKEAFFVVHCCLDIKGWVVYIYIYIYIHRKETINKEEWVILCRKIYNNKQDSDKINNIFEFYDINNDGFLVQKYNKYSIYRTSMNFSKLVN